MLKSVNSLKEEACWLEEEAQYLGDRGIRKNGSSSGRLGGRRFLLVSEGSYSTPLHILSSTPQESLLHSICHCLPSVPSGAYRCHTWSLWSCSKDCRTGTRSCLSSCLLSFRGSSPCEYAAPLHLIWGHQKSVQMLGWGLQRGTINLTCYNLHTCVQSVLGVGLMCPSCGKSFFNPDTFRCHKKSHLSL